MSTTPDQYAVFGNPIGHSKSPQIHMAFAAATGQQLSYRAIEAPIGGLADAIAHFRSGGGCGCNVTVPFKADAFALAEQVDEAAQLAGAVNTLYWDESGKLQAFNTDGKGLLRDLQHNLGIDLAGRRILIIGAGGAAAGVVYPLLLAEPKELVIINRTASRAQALVNQFLQVADDRLRVASMSDPGNDYDLVINATSAGLSGEMPELPESLFAAHSWAYDLVYADEPTQFMRWSTAHGAASCSDGLGMLVEQAAEAFFIWRGVRPMTQEVIQGLR